ncbi:uncharacterized protein K02A2.6-like [Amborella trichopoda]|uniref:uncharacterized protein K02A2.6-like n=1 Tax=Amborella trichopoda TaxID=13333 RepID=UPI0005D3ED86|nr:uncharacterized protein K02A2.6-like [Amborella trichopoda]|eukprot:XP_011621989.1 uncharacterized protein K02A2.6-like [Amborella trichopoda]
MHSSLIHQALELLHPTVTSWLFSQWDMDIVGPIDPPSAFGHAIILATTGYFSKLAAEVPLKLVSGTTVANFVHHHIIYRFGVSDRIISDKGPRFRSHHIDHLVNQFGFEWKYLTIYYPRANGLAEAFNKTLCGVLQKSVSKSRKN